VKVLAKLRRGVVELAAGDECLYAEPTFFQRAYLLWTFRNFRRLSVRVLNDRQRQIVERLSQAAHSTEAKKINPELVIGRAEFAKLPAKKPLEWVIVPQTRDTHVALSRTARPRRAHQLATLPRTLARQVAKALSNHPSRQVRSHARYSLVVTLALASLVIISGAVAERLWINHAKPSVPIGAPLAVDAPARTDTVTGIQPTSLFVTPMAVTNTNAPTPASPAALQLSPQSTTATSSKIKPVIPVAESATADEGLRDTGAITTSNRLRVNLAPRSVIYPAIPNSGLSSKGKKQILVKALINANGVVDDVQVSGQTPNLATAIAKTVKQWRYQPYLLNGQAVEVETRMIFTVLGPDAITVRFLLASENPENN
jgi:Gram-negative bacterial TonB protein C-terminal